MSFAEQIAEHFIARQSILERYIDLAPIPCFIINRLGRTIFVNEAYQQAFDMRLDQIHEGQWQQLIHEDDRDYFVRKQEAMVAGKTTFVFEKIRTVVRGEVVPCLVKINHVPGNGYIGYLLFQCSNPDTICPVRSIVERCLQPGQTFSQNVVPENTNGRTQ